MAIVNCPPQAASHALVTSHVALHVSTANDSPLGHLQMGRPHAGFGVHLPGPVSTLASKGTEASDGGVCPESTTTIPESGTAAFPSELLEQPIEEAAIVAILAVTNARMERRMGKHSKVMP